MLVNNKLSRKPRRKCVLCGAPAVTKCHCLKHALEVKAKGRRRAGSRRKLDSLTARLARAGEHSTAVADAWKRVKVHRAAIRELQAEMERLCSGAGELDQKKGILK